MRVNKKLLSRIEDILSNYPPFKDITVKVDVLQKQEKGEYWGTSVLRYVTDGVNKLSTEGTIYLNFRDARDVNDILKQVNHEGNHLLGGDTNDTAIMEWLQSKMSGEG